MPQSLIRTAPDVAQWLEVGGRALSGAHAQIVSILRSRLGHNHGALLAQPGFGADGSVSWTTSLPGAVVRAADLPEDERASLTRRAERIVGDVRSLAQQMRAEGATGPVVAEILEQAMQWPAGDWLFSVDGKPVFAMWGHALPASVPAPALASPAPAPAPAPTPTLPASAAPLYAVSAAAPPPAAAAMATTAADRPMLELAGSPAAPPHGQAPPPSPSLPPAPAAPLSGGGDSRRRWLLLAAALPLMGGLLFVLSRCSAGPGAGLDLSGSIAEAQAHIRSLEDQLVRQRTATMKCLSDAPAPQVLAQAPQPEPPVAVPPPEVPAAPPEEIASRPPARVPPSAPPATRPEAPRMPQMPDLTPALAPAATPGPAPAPPQKQACKPRRPGDEPEVIMIVDASGSMRERFGNMSRLEAAKRAADAVIRGLPPEVDVGLVDFTACNQVRRDKFYREPERGALIGEINGLSPKAGTPLAQAIERAGRVASDSAEAVLVVVSDGGDSCGGDPCAAARRLKSQRPKVVVNVIDLSDSASDRAVLQCVANAGGGRVLRPGDPIDLQRKMKEAAGSAACTS